MPAPRRTHSVQDRHGQTVYVPSTDPVSADIGPSTVTLTPGAVTTAPPPPSAAAAAGSPSGGGITVTAPAGVDVRHDPDSRTFTLTFGVDDAAAPASTTTTTTKVSSGQLIWQPQRPAAAAGASEVLRGAPAADVRDAADTGGAPARPPPLSRILTESTDEPPDTPTSPDERKSQYRPYISLYSRYRM